MVGTAPVRQGDSFFVGVMLLLLVVLLWTASNFLTNYQLYVLRAEGRAGTSAYHSLAAHRATTSRLPSPT